MADVATLTAALEAEKKSKAEILAKSQKAFKQAKAQIDMLKGKVAEGEGLLQKERDSLARRLAEAERIDPPALWPRDPPVRFRKTVPDCWISLTIREGRNRQVRRMTAAVGLPTLRLVRVRIGDWMLGDLQPGQWRELPSAD